MFGRHFESMYTGSMIGSGSVVFALMGYIIAHMRPPEFDVELNPKLLAFILGDSEEDIQGAIEFLTTPDPKSRSKAEGGRRLVRRGEYLYHVVNGETYNAIRNDADKKAYWRDQKKRQRMMAKASENGGEPPEIPPTPKPKFVKPTREELNLHAAKIGLPDSEVDAFVNFYESKGWMVGKNKMQSWPASMSGWKGRWERSKGPQNPETDRNAGNANDAESVRNQYDNVGKVKC